MEEYKSDNAIGIFHDDFCREKSEEDVKEILEAIAQKTYRHLATKEKTA